MRHKVGIGHRDEHRQGLRVGAGEPTKGRSIIEHPAERPSDHRQPEHVFAVGAFRCRQRRQCHRRRVQRRRMMRVPFNQGTRAGHRLEVCAAQARHVVQACSQLLLADPPRAAWGHG